MSDFIERLTVKNYGCVKDVSVELTPLHAFIGPNDSGKSTLLRAVRTLVQLAGDTFQGPLENLQPFDPGFSRLSDSILGLNWRDVSYLVEVVQGAQFAEQINISGKQATQLRRNWYPNTLPNGSLRNVSQRDSERFFRGARLLRLDADALRKPSRLIPKGQKTLMQDERGFGLPAIYDVIVNQNVEGFLAIKKRMRELFPSIQSIGLDNISESTKAIQIQLLSGEWIPAQFMSEGLLYYLAFAAIPYLDPAAVILVEEPENGLHPARIAEVMRVLREVSKTTQVLLATHSPLVINEMKPEEVSIVTRPPEKGTQVTRIDKTPGFEDRAKVYALGELWLSYADGEYEKPLLEGGPRP
jgi:predicted ATPase